MTAILTKQILLSAWRNPDHVFKIWSDDEKQIEIVYALHNLGILEVLEHGQGYRVRSVVKLKQYYNSRYGSPEHA